MPLPGNTDQDCGSEVECRHETTGQDGCPKMEPKPVQPARASRIRALALKHRDQVLFAGMCLFALVSLAAYCAKTSHWGADPIELQRQPSHELDYRIDLNVASWVEWSQLPGIGPVLAQRIVAEREQHGPFRSDRDLLRVKGIGDKRLHEIRPYIHDAWSGAVPPAVQDAHGTTMPDRAP